MRVGLRVLGSVALCLVGCSDDAFVDTGPLPVNASVVWESNREDGRREIYLMRTDGTAPKRLSHNGGTQAAWAPDGRWISYGELVDHSAHVVRPDGSEDKKISSGEPMFWMHDNSGLVCREGADYVLVDPDRGTKKLFFRQRDFSRIGGHTLAPWPGGGGISHDGRWLVAGTDLYREGFSGDNGAFKARFAAVILDLQNKDKVYFFGSGCWPVTPPSGELIYHVRDDSPDYPDLARMSLSDLLTRRSYATEVSHADADWGHEYNPHVSSDGKWLVYMASRGCHSGDDCDYEIFVHRLGAAPDQRARLTHHPALDAYPDLYVSP